MKKNLTCSTASSPADRCPGRITLYQRRIRRRPMNDAEVLIARWMIGDREGITETECRDALRMLATDVLGLTEKTSVMIEHNDSEA